MSVLTMIVDALRSAVAELRQLGGQVGERPRGDLTEDEVQQVLKARLADHREATNYNTSIVDLMKLLDLDPNLENRKELAEDFGYDGKLDGSAAMNTFLHKKVMEHVAKFYPRPGNEKPV